MVSRLAFTAGAFLFRSAARSRRAAKESKETASQEKDIYQPILSNYLDPSANLGGRTSESDDHALDEQHVALGGGGAVRHHRIQLHYPHDRHCTHIRIQFINTC